MRFLRLSLLRALCAGLMVLLSVSPALAQPEDEKPFYDVNTKEHVKPFIPWTIAVGFTAACLLIAVKNPHRSHLD